MPTILSLPLELILEIASELHDPLDVLALTSTCRSLRGSLTTHLYRRLSAYRGLLFWAVRNGHVGTVERLLEVSDDANICLYQYEPNTTWRRRTEEDRMFNIPIDDSQASDQEQPSDSDGLDSEGEAVQRSRKKDSNGLPSSHVLRRLAIGTNSAYRTKYCELHIFESSNSRLEDQIDFDLGDIHDDDADAAAGEAVDQGLLLHLHELPAPPAARYFWQTHGLIYWSPLHAAAATGNNDMINLLLRYGADINASSRGCCDCVYPSSSKSRIEMSERTTWLTSDWLPLRHRPFWTPLHLAICHGHLSTAALLLSEGALIHVSTRHAGAEGPAGCVSALHTACNSGAVETARWILENGYQTDLEEIDHLGLTPLACASYAGNYEMVWFLVERGASMDVLVEDLPLLGYACLNGWFVEAMDLLDHGAPLQSVHYPYRLGDLLLSLCCMRPSIVYCLRRIRMSPSKDSWRQRGQDAMRASTVRRLIESGADVDATHGGGLSPLCHAAFWDLADTVKILLKAKAKLDNPSVMEGKALIAGVSPYCLWNDDPLFSYANVDADEVLENYLSTVKQLVTRRTKATDVFEAAQYCFRIFDRSRSDPSLLVVLALLLDRTVRKIKKSPAACELVVEAIQVGNNAACKVMAEHGLVLPRDEVLRPLIQEIVAKHDEVGFLCMLNFPGAEQRLRPEIPANASMAKLFDVRR